MRNIATLCVHFTNYLCFITILNINYSLLNVIVNLDFQSATNINVSLDLSSFQLGLNEFCDNFQAYSIHCKQNDKLNSIILYN